MSKTDNLTDFLTDVADAIREKKGTTEKINPQNFSDEIRSIKGGGGGAPFGFASNRGAFYFDDGMTWNDWVDSEYNTDGWYIEEDYIMVPPQGLGSYEPLLSDALGSTYVSPQDRIIHLHYYYSFN